MPAGKLIVYHDAACSFCQWAQTRTTRWDTAQRLEFRDYRAHAAETPFALAELSRHMHVRTPDGRWHVGFFGWGAVLKALPRWRWLGHLLAWPPLRWLGPPGYALVAGNRYRIPRRLLRWLGAPEPCLATPKGARTCD